MKIVCKKIGFMVITVLVVSFLVFLAFAVIPGDPAISKLGTQATPESIAALREQMGLNRPLPVRFFSWLLGLFRGDLGISYSYNMPVQSMLADKLPITLTLTLMSFLIIVLLALPLGLYSAKHEGSIADQGLIIWNQIVMAVPPFFFGILITWLLGLVLKLFVPGGFVSYKESMGGFLYYMLFPSLAIAAPKAAMAAKLFRSSLLQEAGKDYVRTAYSRGNDSTGVLHRHILKNAVIPLVTFLGMTLADILAGSVIMEQVFGIPGIGRILLTSISNRDYPVVQAIIVLIAIWVLLMNCIVDILYGILDPRMEG